jgi:3D (Asp-Asp-Asp) domain-containing protein
VSGRRAQSAATLAGLSAIVVLATVSAAVAARPGGNTASLQGQANALDTRAHRALLDLYAIDTRLETAQAARASLETRAASLRGQQVLLGQELAATRLTLAASRHHLAANLRTLYEQGDTDALAVMLGATSLDDAITRLDDLSRVADLSKQVVEVTGAAQIRLARVRSALAVRRVQLNAALASARRTTRDLAAARSGRLAFIARLRSEQQLKARQISALRLTAQKTAVKSQQLQSAADAVATAAPADPTSVTAPAQAAVPPGGRTITVSSTGYSLPGHTATGLPVGWGVVAVDPALIPLGTRITVPGYGEAVAADTGSAVRGATIDLWFPTLAQARAWGRRTLTITLH